MEVEPPPPGGQLQRYRSTLSRRKWWVIVPTLLGVLTAFALRQGSEQIYEARALVRPTDPSQSSVFQEQQTERGAETDRVIASTIQLIQSPEVTDKVKEKLGDRFAAVESVEVTALPETLFVDISTRSADQSLAQQAATVWADTYVEEQTNLDVSALGERRDRLRESATDIDTKIEEINSELSTIERNLVQTNFEIDQLAALRVAGEDVLDALVESTIAKAEFERQQEFAISDRNSRSEEARFLREEAEKLDIEAAYRAQTGAQVASRPEGASDVGSSGFIRDVVIFAMLGLVVGVGLALAREYFDPKIKTAEELHDITPGVPMLGVIPRLGGNTATSAVVTENEPWFAAEAYRDLRTAVLNRSKDEHTCLVLSSVGANAGTTSTAINLAASLAQSGKQVLLIDANLRRPAIHHQLDLDNELGLSSLLTDATTPEQAVLTSPTLTPTRVALLSAGPKHDNPAELIQHRMDKVLSWASQSFDYVVVDTPPADLFTDASIIALMAHGLVLVVRPEVTDHTQLVTTVDKLRTIGVTLRGTILNAQRNIHTKTNRYADRVSYRNTLNRHDHQDDSVDDRSEDPTPVWGAPVGEKTTGLHPGTGWFDGDPEQEPA